VPDIVRVGDSGRCPSTGLAGLCDLESLLRSRESNDVLSSPSGLVERLANFGTETVGNTAFVGKFP